MMRAEDILAARPTLDGVIYDELRRRIISLTYLPGMLIFENAVAAEFEVSRTPVRQAFFRLEKEDLLQILPQRGARVSKLSVAKVKQAQFVRESLEISAFDEVARLWDERNPDHRRAAASLLACIDAQRAAVAERDYVRFARLDEDYHNTVIGLSGNTTLLGIVNDMRAHLNRLRYLELQEAHHEDEAIVHHKEILTAIRRNDRSVTVERLRVHLKMLEEFRGTLFDKYRDVFA
jgi:DNA-binding GntR family transcriptional regulator